jgi:hypothetical protein
MSSSFNVKDALLQQQPSVQPSNIRNKDASHGKGAGKHNKSKKQHEKTKSIGHYIIGKAIGEGTFGKVKLGTHILTGEKVMVLIYFS